MAALEPVPLTSGTRVRYLLKLTSPDALETRASVVLVVMKRDGGLLLALPPSVMDATFLDTLVTGSGLPIFGPSTILSVPAVTGLGEDAVPVGLDVEVKVVDADPAVLEDLDYCPEMVPVETGGFTADPLVVPDPELLLVYVQEWIVLQEADMQNFYSAAEAEALDGTPLDEEETPQQTQTPKANPNVKPKRTTTASLASEIAKLTELLPAMSQKLDRLQKDHLQLAEQVSSQSRTAPVRASQMPVSAPLQSFAKMLGSPPRTKAPGSMSPALVQAEPSAAEIDENLEEFHAPGGSALAQAVLQQSKALTSLVSQLQNGDPLLDMQTAASSGSLGSKGAQGREKLQNELSNRSGNFCLAVCQNAHRRMKPAQRVPQRLLDLKGSDFSMVTYLEKFGGYGNSRDLGLMQFCLAHVMDCVIQEDWEGVREHMALTMTAVEQACQDGGRWDLAYQLTLLEEPSSQIWTYKPSMPHSRLRAFAPLCPQRWATVALAYTKEVDFLMNRRAELTKKPTPPPPNPTQPSPKKPGKGKKKGAATDDSTNEASGA